MHEDTLRKLVNEICGEASDGEHHVGDGTRLMVFFGAQGALETVGDVRSIRIAEGYLTLTNRARETYWVGLDRIVALKTLHRARGGAGF